MPGFPELLAKRTPALIAIDEAHCISQWGHDFRPEYRMLGQRLPALRPAPIIALTATATPRVQADIVEQLGLGSERRFIHGFRRTNIAIEVVEVAKPDRGDVVRAVLTDKGRRPAIVYAPTRAEAEALAETLGKKLQAAAYHAGMSASARDGVQARFIGGELDVIVATIAFGMGIDKADVRTVIHTALPQTLEGYYQEIGRAGRDGQTSRAILLHSFADRKTLEFFHDANYPAPSRLEAIYRCLTEAPQPKNRVQRQSGLDEEDFERALDKLWIHRGAVVDPEENITRGQRDWAASYTAQREHRALQAEQMGRFAQSHGCRMLHIVEHFGDHTDGGTACGICDVCAHQSCSVQSFRALKGEESKFLGRIIDTLRISQGMSTGSLHKEALSAYGVERRAFELLISSLTRAGLITVEDESFEKGGRKIQFQRVYLTGRGQKSTKEDLAALQIPTTPLGLETAVRSRAQKKERRARSRADVDPALAPPALIEALRAWRLAEAKRRKVPAFRIMPDRTLVGIAEQSPTNVDALRGVNGVGRVLAERYGEEIVSTVAAVGGARSLPRSFSADH